MMNLLRKLKGSNIPLDEALNILAEFYTLSKVHDPLAYIDTSFLVFPPGHYHSPLPDKAEVERVGKRAFQLPVPDSIPGVELGEREQLKLYGQLARYYSDCPFKSDKTPGLRYYFSNMVFSYSDAFWLYSMLRHFKPGRIVEVGSGFSSCVILDTWENFMDGPLKLTMIEPNPERLLQNIESIGNAEVDLHQALVQDVPVDFFRRLEPGDFLFVDNSHVGKIGSDVLFILFEALPVLNSGVIVHFHDIFYPFEYPKSWLEKGRAWNEAYLIRAFLQYNKDFEILLFGDYLHKKHSPMLAKYTPLCNKHSGCSLWLRKI